MTSRPQCCGLLSVSLVLRVLPALAASGLALPVEQKLGAIAWAPTSSPRPPGTCLSTLPLPLPCVRLLGTDPEETILHAFKVFDTEGKGFVKADL